MKSPYRVLGFTLLPLLRSRISKIHGLENIPAGGFIAVANHQSWVDSGIMGGTLYRSIKKSLRFVAQSSKYRMFGGIPINEYDPASVLDVAGGYLKAGHSIVIFPEGNSNADPKLRIGKTGAAKIASLTGAPVVPIGIRGTHGVSAIRSIVWFFSWWKPLEVFIGQPQIFALVEPVNITKELLEARTAIIMSAISAVSGKPYDELSSPRSQRKVSFLRRLLWKFALPMFRYRVKIEGAEHLPQHGPFIIAANHSSYFDPGSILFAVYATRHIQPYFLTKGAIARTWKNILGREAWQVLGMLPIDNADKSKVLRAAESHLRRDGVIGIFPEGTRNKPRLNPDWQTTMLRGHTGVARLVISTGAPVIPAAIFAPMGLSIWGTIKNVLRFWQSSRIVFGPAIEFDSVPHGEPSKEQLDELTRKVMLRIAALRGLRYPY